MHPAVLPEAAERGVSMKKAVLVIFIVVFALAALLLLVQRGGKRTRIPQRGDPAPQFQLQSLDGRTVRLADLRGKAVIVHFWATWCPPCVEELPALERFYGLLKGKPVELLAISVDDTGAETVREFMRKNGLTLPVLLDPDKQVAASYGTFKFPETYLLDRNGIIRDKVIGAADWTRPEAMELIDALLREQ